nr:uncharacterized protein LOC124812491 [Hydra vulgaris]
MDWSVFISKRQAIKSNKINALYNQNDTISTTGKDKANTLNKQFHSVFIQENELERLPFFESQLVIKPIENINFTNDKVQSNILIFIPFKVVGGDGISPNVLKMCAGTYSLTLQLIFQVSYNSGCIPNDWTKANVSPILKKGSKLEPSNYRLVSITSVPCKVMDHLIWQHINNHLTINNLTTKEQPIYSNAQIWRQNV